MNYPLDHSIELSDQLGALFDSGTGCDFTLTFSYPPEESLEVETLQSSVINTEESICVHRVVLSLFPKFVADNSTYEMVISSNCKPYIRDFIRYLYTRSVTASISSMQCLHQLAAEFGAERLREDIGRLFVPLLPEDTSFRTQVALFRYARRSGDDLLRENVLRYLGWNLEPLVASAQWKSLPEELLKALLLRTDLVLPDEAWLLAALEAWMLEQGEAWSPEQQAALLAHVRFPMMSPQQLYELPFTTRLYSSHTELFHSAMLLAFQFHALNFSVLTQRVDGHSVQFQARIYTAEPWSVSFNVSKRSPSDDWRRGYGYESYGYGSYGSYGSRKRRKTFNTPLPLTSKNSNREVSWAAEVFASDESCRNYGSTCKEFSGRLQQTGPYYAGAESDMQFRNQLLLVCRENYVFHVQEFKNNEAKISNNTMDVQIPCPDDLTYRFVVRPQFLSSPSSGQEVAVPTQRGALPTMPLMQTKPQYNYRRTGGRMW